MAQFCEVCGRGPQMSNLRSKSNIATKRRQKVNVQPKKLDGKEAGETNKKNIGIVESQLGTYRAELAEIRKARQGAPFADLMGMLGGAANELFDEYRKNFSGQDRKTRDLELLSRICDDLGDIRKQMNDLARAESNDMNAQNLAIVVSQLTQFEEEWEAISAAKGNK